MNSLYCHGFLKYINSVVIIKCPKRMLRYYFSKGFDILECNYNNLAKLSIEVKQIIYAKEVDNSDYAMTCINTIPYTLNIINRFLLNKSLHSSYIQREFNKKEEIIKKIFGSDVELLLKDINNPAFFQ